MTTATITDAFKLANQYHEAGRLQQAEQIYRQILAKDPNHANSIHYLGLIAHQTGNTDVAVDLMRKAIALNPNLPEAHNNLGNVLRDKGDPDQAIASYRRSIALRPDHAEALANLGCAFRDKGQMTEAIAAYRKSLDIYRRANAVGTYYAYVHSNLVYGMHYQSEYDAAAIGEECRAWGRAHGRPLKKFVKPHNNDRNPDRRLRIGYVSGDLRWHSVGRNLLPLLHKHNREQFEIFCYAHVLRPDPLTQLLRQQTDGWRSIIGIPDEPVAEKIREDKIDILVDLAVHSADNRLLVFARKPAPVQVSYLGYCSSTGMEAMDYRLSDPHMDPEDFDLSVYTEKTIRLPNTYWCYQALAQSPDSTRKTGEPLTFGCLNTFAKVSPEAQTLWAKILQSVPGSNLLLHTAEGSHRQTIQDFFSSFGIDPQRIRFVPNQSYTAYLQTYSQIDIALDPFPYGGGITTLDSLWHGVPVVTLSGKTAVGRGGRSILTNIGLTDLIAYTRDDYVHIVADLARDADRRAELRKSLRGRVKDSPLKNPAKFAQEVESAYRTMWRNWCQS
jgi:protein O-GlcNAc transferase